MALDPGESYYEQEIVPPALDAFTDRLVVFYRVPADNAGTRGNLAHVKGRHRSIDWCLNSIYCTNRDYGTRDPRDTRGNHRHIRAFDFQFPTAAEFHAACHRLDTAVRAGQLPELAEWFGTFDGVTVVGWFEGHPGIADPSHLEHLHGGIWTEHADDQAFYDRLFNIITGGDFMAGLTDNDQKALAWRVEGLVHGRTAVANGPTKGEPIELNIRAAAQDAAIAALAAQVGMDPAELDAVKAAAREGALAGAEAALTPEALAAAIPDELAAEVADILAARLAS